ncbi:MAG: GntR family transcriptional regulator [Chloroflexota bacterium]
MTGLLYIQVADALRSRLGQAAWKMGDRLPSEEQLCRDLGVSSITMRRAVAMLVAEGLLVRLQGKGTFVSNDHAIVHGPPQMTSFTQDMQMRGWKASARVISFHTERAPALVATKLGVSEMSPVCVLSRVRLADNLPVALQTAHLPALLFGGLERFDFSRESLYEVLEREYAIKPAVAVENYQASLVDAEEARVLQLAPGSPAFRVERLTSDSGGRRIELVQSVIRGDRYALVLRLSASRQPAWSAFAARSLHPGPGPGQQEADASENDDGAREVPSTRVTSAPTPN